MEIFRTLACGHRALLTFGLILGATGIASADPGARAADVLYAVELDDLSARPAQLVCTAPSRADERPGLEVRNAGEADVLLFLSNGGEILLPPGEAMKLSTEKADSCICVCICQEHAGRRRSQERDVKCIGDDPDRCPKWNDKKCFFLHSDGSREKANATYRACEGAGAPE